MLNFPAVAVLLGWRCGSLLLTNPIAPAKFSRIECRIGTIDQCIYVVARARLGDTKTEADVYGYVLGMYRVAVDAIAHPLRYHPAFGDISVSQDE
jgi:hypothetical protein